MADTAISALSAASTLAGTEPFPVVQGGTTKKATATQIAAYAATAYGLVKNNITTTDPGLTDDSGSGYAGGSTWFNTATGACWICRSASASAAVWIRLDIADHPGYVSGNWYPSLMAFTAANGGAVPASSIRLYPFKIYERVTLSSLGARITSAAASGQCQLGIYGMSLSTKLPTGNVIASTADIGTGSAALVNAAINGGNKTFEPGWYFGAVIADATAGGTVGFSAISNVNAISSGPLGSATQADLTSNATIANFILTFAQTYGTWPDLTGQTFARATGASANMNAHLHLKVA